MLLILSAETQKWFDQNHTSRSTKPISARDRSVDARLRLVAGTSAAAAAVRQAARALRGWVEAGAAAVSGGFSMPPALAVSCSASRFARSNFCCALRSWRKSNTRRDDSALPGTGRIGDAPGVRPIDLGEQRAARIGRDRRDRAGTRTEAEPMQMRARPEFSDRRTCAEPCPNSCRIRRIRNGGAIATISLRLVNHARQTRFRRAARTPATCTSSSSITWMPLLPLTTCVTRRSAARLHSV